MPTIDTFRSKVITANRCMRERFLSYEMDLQLENKVRGLSSTRISIPLTTGSAIHEGMAVLLATGDIELAISKALDLYRVTVTASNLLIEPMKGDEGIGLKFGSDVMEWVVGQEMALVEALVRGFHSAVYPMFIERYDILSIEKDMRIEVEPGFNFLTKTDALVREKSTGLLVIQSFKSLAYWNWKAQVSYLYDPQNFAEPWGVNEKLKEWWTRLQQAKSMDVAVADIPAWMFQFVDSEESPHVNLVQMGILKKGTRKDDPKRGNGFKIQYSPLITGYVNHNRVDSLGPNDPSCYAWSWDVPKESKEGNVYMGTLGKDWKRMFVWKDVPGGVKQWIEWLAAGEVQPEIQTSPFMESFDFSEPVEKRQDQIDRWVKGMVWKEKTIAEHADLVNECIKVGDWAKAIYYLDLLFPANGQCARYGGLCSFTPVCWENPNMLVHILDGGLFKARESHHELEGEEVEL